MLPGRGSPPEDLVLQIGRPVGLYPEMGRGVLVGGVVEGRLEQPDASRGERGRPIERSGHCFDDRLPRTPPRSVQGVHDPGAMDRSTKTSASRS